MCVLYVFTLMYFCLRLCITLWYVRLCMYVCMLCVCVIHVLLLCIYGMYVRHYLFRLCMRVLYSCKYVGILFCVYVCMLCYVCVMYLCFVCMYAFLDLLLGMCMMICMS